MTTVKERYDAIMAMRVECPCGHGGYVGDNGIRDPSKQQCWPTAEGAEAYAAWLQGAAPNRLTRFYFAAWHCNLLYGCGHWHVHLDHESRQAQDLAERSFVTYPEHP